MSLLGDRYKDSLMAMIRRARSSNVLHVAQFAVNVLLAVAVFYAVRLAQTPSAVAVDPYGRVITAAATKYDKEAVNDESFRGMWSDVVVSLHDLNMLNATEKTIKVLDIWFLEGAQKDYVDGIKKKALLEQIEKNGLVMKGVVDARKEKITVKLETNKAGGATKATVSGLMTVYVAGRGEPVSVQRRVQIGFVEGVPTRENPTGFWVASYHEEDV